MAFLKNTLFICTKKFIFLALCLIIFCGLMYMILIYQKTYFKVSASLQDEKTLEVKDRTFKWTKSNLLNNPPKVSSEKYVDINAYQYIINEPNRCKDQNPTLVLLIATVATEVQQREAIRSTYGSVTSNTGIPIVSLFMLGTDNTVDKDIILGESEKYHDIIQKDFQDTYKNLTIKTLMGIDWISTYCPKAEYVLKTDSDMFVNTERILKLFEQVTLPKQNYFTGYVLRNHKPHRHRSSKWYMPYSLFQDEFYPTFCSGTGYLFSGDIAPKILRASFREKLVYLEDVFVGICLDKEGVPIVSPPGNNLFNNYLVPFNPCVYNNIITSHYVNPSTLITYWKTMQVHKDRCTNGYKI